MQIIHHSLYCKNCTMPTLLPVHTLEQPFAALNSRPNDVQAIAFACHSCKSVETYFLDRNHPKHNQRDMVIPMEPRTLDVVHVSTLGCGEEGCRSQVPLFAQWIPTTTSAERKDDIQLWQWEHLTCPEGHSIPRPSSFFRPLR